MGAGNITIHDRKGQRYQCKICKQTFSARRGTMFEGLRKPMELIVIVVTLLSYGCPVQAIVHAFSLDERTVACAGYLGHPFRKSAVVDEGASCLANAREIRVQSTRSILRMRSDRTPFS